MFSTKISLSFWESVTDFDDAEKVKERIAKEMTSAGIAEAQKLSREYWEAYVSSAEK